MYHLQSRWLIILFHHCIVELQCVQQRCGSERAGQHAKRPGGCSTEEGLTPFEVCAAVQSQGLRRSTPPMPLIHSLQTHSDSVTEECPTL